MNSEAALLGPTLPGLLALLVWSVVVTPFVLPWLYVCYVEGNLVVPYAILRGPWQ